MIHRDVVNIFRSTVPGKVQVLGWAIPRQAKPNPGQASPDAPGRLEMLRVTGCRAANKYTTNKIRDEPRSG